MCIGYAYTVTSVLPSDTPSQSPHPILFLPPPALPGLAYNTQLHTAALEEEEERRIVPRMQMSPLPPSPLPLCYLTDGKRGGRRTSEVDVEDEAEDEDVAFKDNKRETQQSLIGPLDGCEGRKKDDSIRSAASIASSRP